MRQTALLSYFPITSSSHQEVQWTTSYKQVEPVSDSSGLPSLHLQFLGGFQIACGDTSVTGIDGPRLQSLLAYLALHAGIPQSRTRLASLLWPDSTEAQAHTNLRNLLCKLRKLLPNAEAFVLVEWHTLVWRDDANCVLDVQDFERAVARAEHAVRNGDRSALRLALEQAIVPYQGELLPSCYDEWVLPERERLSQLYLNVLERLLHLRDQENDSQGAIRVAQGILRADPLHEAAYRHLMCLFAKSGNRSAAIRLYHTCTAALARELGVEPTPTTRQVYEQLVS